MQLRKRKFNNAEADILTGGQKKMLLSANDPIATLPFELFSMIIFYLDFNDLKELCCVSPMLQNSVQRILFAEFSSSLYDQRGLWKRLQLLGNALTARQALGEQILHISIQLADLRHVEQLTKLLRPILNKAPNLRSLSLPVHRATANVIATRTFNHLGSYLKIKEVYHAFLGLNCISLVWSSAQCDRLYACNRPNETRLQRVVIGPCELYYRDTLKLLRQFRSLEGLELRGVELYDSAPSLGCESKVAGIVRELSSSSPHLTSLVLLIDGDRHFESGITRVLSLECFSSLQYLEVNEHDIAPTTRFPTSLTSLWLFDWETTPTFPFTSKLAVKLLPLRLRSITSCSRDPNKLRTILTQTWNAPGIDIYYEEYDDSPPRGSFRRPNSPSW